MSLQDSFIGLQPDGPGKQVDTELSLTNSGTVQTQRALLVGRTQDVLEQLLMLSMQQLALLRAINANLQILAGSVDENDTVSTIQDIG